MHPGTGNEWVNNYGWDSLLPTHCLAYPVDPVPVAQSSATCAGQCPLLQHPLHTSALHVVPFPYKPSACLRCHHSKFILLGFPTGIRVVCGKSAILCHACLIMWELVQICHTVPCMSDHVGTRACLIMWELVHV